MNAYEATMKAADHIERNPRGFDFTKDSVPDCGSPGCALGWIGHFACVRKTEFMYSRQVAKQILALRPEVWAKSLWSSFEHHSCEDGAFYNRMDELCGSQTWTENAGDAARTMRLYAAKYLKPTIEPTKPDWNAIATAGNAYRAAAVVS